MMVARTRSAACRGMAQWAMTISTLALAATLATPALAQEVPADPNAPPSNLPGNPDDQAADNPPAPAASGGEEVVVTGIRAGIRGSIDTKRRADGIVEAVTAEDIGKLPDISIAESIARLPGLAAQRVNGRAQVISIRGLAPDFTTTLLNGRQQASSGDNRAVEFDQYPSELLNSVVVYKTPDANIAGFGLSGTADLRTVRPLAYGKRAIAINVRGEVNATEKRNADMGRWGGRGSISYIDKLTPELGIAVGLAYLNSPSSNQHTKAYNFETFCCGQEQRITPVEAQDATFLTGQEVFAYSRNNKRLAGIGILEWQPSDTVHSTLDLYYSKFKQKEVMRGAQWFSNVWADDQTFTNVQTADRGGTELAVTGVANGVAPILRNDLNTRTDNLFSAGLNNEFKLSEQLSLTSDLSYSSNKRRELYVETYAGYGCDPNNVTPGPECVTAADQNANRVFDSIAWDISGNGFLQYDTGLNYADASQVTLGDRAPWGGWGHDGLYKAPHVREQIYSTDNSLRYEPNGGFFQAIDVGFNFTRRDKKKRVDEWDLNLKNDRLQTLVDPEDLLSPTSLDFAGFGDVLAIDLTGGTIGKYYDLTVLEDANHFDKAWKIREDVLTLKARAQFVSGPIHGNIGLQAVRQKQNSSGLRIDQNSLPINIEQVSEGDSYWDVLPSLNAYYDFGGGHRLRFAAAKVLARPKMDELRANLTPSFANPCTGSPPCVPGQTINPWSASGGNPNLKPWRAKAVDLSYEWYIGPSSYFALAGFYKKLDSYIYLQALPYDFSGLPIPTNVGTVPDGVIIDPMGTITTPANGKGGNVRGLEFSGALEFGRVAKFLDGFGVTGSISKTKSSLKSKNPGDDPLSQPTRRIPGLSGTVASITGYYEKHGFQARLSYRYRSAFKGEITALYAVRAPAEILADKQVDGQIGYTFPEKSRFENLGILLQVYNLTNSPYRTRIGLDSGGPTTESGGKFVETYEKYGRQVLFGISYRF